MKVYEPLKNRQPEKFACKEEEVKYHQMDVEHTPQGMLEMLVKQLRTDTNSFRVAYRDIVEGTPEPETKKFFKAADGQASNYLEHLSRVAKPEPFQPKEGLQKWLYLGGQWRPLFIHVGGAKFKLGPDFQELQSRWSQGYDPRKVGDEMYRIMFNRSDILTDALQRLKFLSPTETLGGLYDKCKFSEILDPSIIQTVSGHPVTIKFGVISGLTSPKFPGCSAESNLMNTGFGIHNGAYVHFNPQVRA